MSLNQRIYKLGLVIIFIALLTSYLFKLSNHCIYIWDESIYANNSLEMSVTKNLLYYTNDYEKNYFNVKPPLVIILQALSLSLFGYSEFALRLPTLMFFLGSIILLIFYSKKLFKDYIVGAEASIFLFLCIGAVRPHVFLSADLDAGLVFFSLLLLLNHLDVCESKQLNKKHWIIYFSSIIFGWLSKSTGIFLVIPALFAISIYYRNLSIFLRDRRLYLAILAVLLFIGFYYFYKYQTDPYYTQLVWETEYMRFVENIMPWHQQPFSYYFVNTVSHFALVHWLGLLIILIVAIKKNRVAKVQYALLLAIAIYLLTISIPAVKLEWYDAFIYPALCLLLSISIDNFFTTDQKWLRFSVNVTLCLLMVIFFESKTKTFYSGISSQELEGDFLKNTNTQYPSLKVLKKVEDDKTEHYNVVRFYLKRNEILDTTFSQKIIAGVNVVQLYDTILCCDKSQIDSLQGLHNSLLLQKRNNCFVYKIIK